MMDDLSITSGLTNRLWRMALWGSVIAILIAPLIAMQFTGEVHWTPFDFAVATALLGTTALGIEFAIRTIGRPTFCVVAVLGILAVLLLVWAELAVGVFGTPFSGNRRTNNAWCVYEAINDHKVDAAPLPDDPSVKPPVPTMALWSRKDGVIAPAAARGLPNERDAAVEVPFRHFAMGSGRAAIDRIVAELGQRLKN